MLWTLLLIVVALWFLGLILEVGRDLIHILLVVSVAALGFSLVTGRRHFL